MKIHEDIGKSSFTPMKTQKEKNSSSVQPIYISNEPQAICFTSIGSRENQEDNFIFNQSCSTPSLTSMQNRFHQPLFLKAPLKEKDMYVVCDGLGGQKAGEKASFLCVKSLLEIETSLQACSSLDEMVQKVQETLAVINDSVLTFSKRDESCRDMGTALIILLAFGKDYALLNLGDCRAYHFDGSDLKQISQDQTEGARMLRLGLLEKEQLDSFDEKESLYNYIGKDSPGLIVQAEVAYPGCSQGLFLLCSDGIYKSLASERIELILKEEPNLEEAGRKILKEAAEKENSDNATLMLIPIRR